MKCRLPKGALPALTMDTRQVIGVYCTLIFCSLHVSRCFGQVNYDRHHENITNLLDSLLRGYNKHLRPGFGGPPDVVTTNILIRSMGPVSEEEMMFSMDCYFRQEWQDLRLAFEPLQLTQNHSLDILRPSIKMLDEIWKPDTFFLNGQDSYLHMITYSNKLFRISFTGAILYSQRLTIKSSCPMHLEKYPLDKQSCPLFIGSYGYGYHDIHYEWKKMSDGKDPVQLHDDISMAQFRLIDVDVDIQTLKDKHNMGNGPRHVLFVNFQLQREIGYYLLQIYLPCYLIVVISWVSFWINREATPARVTLGITTLLTTCTIAITGREGIPKVSYSTALDIYLLMCFSFVFAALVEYAGVNYFTKTGIKEVHEESDEEQEVKKPLIRNHLYNHTGCPQGTAPQSTGHALTATDINGHTIHSVHSNNNSCHGNRDSCFTMFLHCLKGNTKYKNMRAMHRTGPVSVSKIDSMAKIIFPFGFTCLNILYWAGFLYYF